MQQVLTFPEPISSVAVRREGRGKFSDEEYWAFCEANRDLHIERTAEGEIVVAPPAGGESDYRNTKAVLPVGRMGRSGWLGYGVWPERAILPA